MVVGMLLLEAVEGCRPIPLSVGGLPSESNPVGVVTGNEVGWPDPADNVFCVNYVKLKSKVVMSKNGKATDLAEARQFAIDKDKFEKLTFGDISAAVNFLLYIRNNEKVWVLLMEEMYKEYLKTIEEKSNPIKDESK